MSNVHVMNHGPGPVVVFDAAGMRADLGEGAHGTFLTPVSISGAAPAVADAPPVDPDPAPGAGAKVNLDAVVINGADEDPVQAAERLLEKAGIAV